MDDDGRQLGPPSAQIRLALWGHGRHLYCAAGQLMDAPATGTRPPNGKGGHVGHRHTPRRRV